jgi:hypothetical protein
LDVTNNSKYKIVNWKIEKAILAPRLGLDLRQYWPYAPYQEMIVTLNFTARALLFFLCMAVLTLIICAREVRLTQIALLGGLFLVPSLILMSGGIAHPESITPALFAGYQIKMLPVISILPLALAFFVLRKLPRLPMVLLLTLMALFMGGYPFAGLLDEQKRNAFEAITQAAMIAYIFALTLFVRIKGQDKN